MEVKIKKLLEEAKIPTYAHQSDAGMDMYATSIVYTKDYIEYGTGISIQLPENHVGLLFPRSSVSKYDLLLCNSVGVLDEGYLGEIKFRFKLSTNDGSFGFNNIYKILDKIGQIIILPFPKIQFVEVEELSNTERGNGGFGSTDKL